MVIRGREETVGTDILIGEEEEAWDQNRNHMSFTLRFLFVNIKFLFVLYYLTPCEHLISPRKRTLRGQQDCILESRLRVRQLTGWSWMHSKIQNLACFNSTIMDLVFSFIIPMVNRRVMKYMWQGSRSVYPKKVKRSTNQNWGHDMQRQWERERSEREQISTSHMYVWEKMYENAIANPVSMLAYLGHF